MLQELKVEEERAALAAVAAALERETLEQAKRKEEQAMGLSQHGVVAEGRNKEEDNQQVAASNLHGMNNGMNWHEKEFVHTRDIGEAAHIGQTLAGDPQEGAASPTHGSAKEVSGDVDAVEKAECSEETRSHELFGLTVAAPEAAVASVHNEVIGGAGLATTKPGSRSSKGGGKNQKQESSVRRGQKAVTLEEEKRAGAQVDEPLKEEEFVAVKPKRKAAKKTVEEREDEEAGIEEAGGWDKEEEAGLLPGLQEGERCCKSNNRSWRCSRSRHPGSRYCIYHIRDYVDGKLIPRKNLPAHEKLSRTQSIEAEAEAPDSSNGRRRTRRRSLQQGTTEGLRREVHRGGWGNDCTDSEGSEGDGLDRQQAYSSGDELVGDEDGGPPPLLPQQHLPMKKRFAVTPGAAREPWARGEFENGASALGPDVTIGASEKELAEWALAHKYSEEARTGGAGGKNEEALQPGIKAESVVDGGSSGTMTAHAPVRAVLGELPDAFLRAQERGEGHQDMQADAGLREPPYRPESSMSPKGESLRRVGMIVEALAGGLDNLGHADDVGAEAHEGHVQERLGAQGNGPAEGVKVKTEDGGELKGEFKRCIMSGGTGWKCGRPRIEDSKYCQYHFELRRKQRLNSGARAAKGAGKRRTPGLKRSTRGSPKGNKTPQEAQPRGRKRKLPKAEPVSEEQEAFPFLSLEFRLQKRTRTKKAVRPHSAVDRLLLAAKVRREDSLELLSEQQAGRQHLRCFQVKVSDLGAADFSEMDEDEAGAHEALTQMLAASTHQGPSSSDRLKKEDNGPERSTGACAELCKKDSADEAAAPTTSPEKAPQPSSPQTSPGATMAARHALKRLVAAEGAGESDGAEPKRSRSEAHEARRLAWELRTAEEARVRLEAEGAQVAWKLKQELATRAKLETCLAELTRTEEAKERPEVAALREEVAALRHELGEERAANGTLRKQIRQLNEQLEAQEAQFLGHQADLEVLEAKHKDLEANIAALLVEKHTLQSELSLLRLSNKCLLCHTLTANTAVDPCGCRFCSSCLMLPTRTQSNGTKDRAPSLALQCPACHGSIKGAIKVLKPALLEPGGCYRTS
ncbi:hypothetical protein KFL_001200280 [Klebsormidium nitens]|uniref:WRC domain-containing protein n=1 Tax=Klebsormidium nitens TaxID=105231 RepID=A0A1Y1HVQ2_KLENI|nr:hypothetical protein KFL_001200280 [Klebsormidium nitens]|eukprot:GAQ82704.1 hypothetical protein KFL_001200280 [Klebsormidium nitens]